MAKKHKFTKEEIQQIKNQCDAFWTKSTLMMENFFDLVNDCERLYRAQLPEELEEEYRKKKSRASLAPPDIHINLKSLRQEIMALLFQRKPYAFLSEHGRPGMRSEKITRAEWLLQNNLDTQSKQRGFRWEADKVILQALYAGRSAAITRWVQETARVVERNPDMTPIRDEKTGMVKFIEKVVAEYPETKSIDIRRVRIDPAAENGGEMRIFAYQELENISDLIKLNRSKNSYYDFNEKELLASSFDRTKYYEYLKGEADQYGDKGMQNDDFGDQIVEVREFRGQFRFAKKDGSVEFKDLVVRTGNVDHILAIKENDLPIYGWELMDYPAVSEELGRFFGMGVVEPMMDVWVEMFIKRNQSLDRANRYTYDRYIADKNATQDLPDILDDVPGIIYKIDLIGAGIQSVQDAMAPLNKPYGRDESFVQASSLKTELKQGMGLNSYLQGLDPQRKESATGIMELVSGGKLGISDLARVLVDTYIAPAWRKQLILINFFKGHETNVSLDDRGREFKIIPGELDVFYNVDIDVTANADNATMQRRWVELDPIMRVDPNYDQYEISKTRLQVLGVPNADRILKDNEHLLDVIERENIALASGVPLFVSPGDDDQVHMEGHQQLIEQLKAEGMDSRVAERHYNDHAQQAEKKQANLGNSKEFGGNAGQIISPTSAGTTGTGSGSGTKPQGRQ